MRSNIYFWIIHTYALFVGATTRGLSCSKESTLPSVEFSISPEFIWFPSDATASDITDTFRASNSQFTITENGVQSRIDSTIHQFLGTACTLHLTVITEKFAGSLETLSLFNKTLSSTDLICKLPAHKIGKTYTDAHILMSSHLKGRISPPNPKGVILENESNTNVNNYRKKKETLQIQPGHAGFEYNINCPEIVNPEDTEPLSLEGLKGIARVRDCQLCQKVESEMQSMCSGKSENKTGISLLENYLKTVGWEYKGSVCEKC